MGDEYRTVVPRVAARPPVIEMPLNLIVRLHVSPCEFRVARSDAEHYIRLQNPARRVSQPPSPSRRLHPRQGT